MKNNEFKKTVWNYYAANARTMPWRQNTDPYWVLVSEIMLQQTQVLRVIPKFETFIADFPTIEALAKASFTKVLTQWSGLGYNRRAKYLHLTAKQIVTKHRCRVPNDQAALRALPGIGDNTAAAIRAYAFNEPTVFVETNVRSVILHHFFPGNTEVRDMQVLEKIQQNLDFQNPREWYWALMDYGAFLKKTNPNPSRRSAHHHQQSKFNGSWRQLRGQVLRALIEKPLNLQELAQLVRDERLPGVVNELVQEAMVVRSDNGLQISA